ncbi:MAG: hypothetical protein ACP6IQ_02080 [Candidatus Njordarchaeia archaeon]
MNNSEVINLFIDSLSYIVEQILQDEIFLKVIEDIEKEQPINLKDDLEIMLLDLKSGKYDKYYQIDISKNEEDDSELTLDVKAKTTEAFSILMVYRAISEDNIRSLAALTIVEEALKEVLNVKIKPSAN